MRYVARLWDTANPAEPFAESEEPTTMERARADAAAFLRDRLENGDFDPVDERAMLAAVRQFEVQGASAISAPYLRVMGGAVVDGWAIEIAEAGE